jgi:hypothetical protein
MKHGLDNGPHRLTLTVVEDKYFDIDQVIVTTYKPAQSDPGTNSTSTSLPSSHKYEMGFNCCLVASLTHSLISDPSSLQLPRVASLRGQLYY